MILDPDPLSLKRRKLWWCDSPDCTEANRHCNDLEAAYLKFKSEFQFDLCKPLLPGCDIMDSNMDPLEGRL